MPFLLLSLTLLALAGALLFAVSLVSQAALTGARRAAALVLLALVSMLLVLTLNRFLELNLADERELIHDHFGWGQLGLALLVFCAGAALYRFTRPSPPKQDADPIEAWFDLVPQPLIRLDAEGNCIAANEHWLALAGIDAEQAAGEGWTSQLHPADHDWVVTRWREDWRNQRRFTAEFRLQPAAGPVLWLRAEARPGYDYETSRLLACANITDLMRHENTIHAAEQRLRHFLHDMPMVMCALNEDGHLIEVNDEFLRVTGYARAELLRDAAMARQLIPNLEERLTQTVEGLSTWEEELPCREAPARRIAWHDMSRQIPLPGWQTWLVGQDVTHLRREQGRLRDSLQRLHSLVEHTPVAVIEWDSNYTVRRWSPMAEQIFGWTAEEALGNPGIVRALVHPDDWPHVVKVIDDLGSKRLHYNTSTNRNVHRSGREIYCKWHNSALFDAEGRIQSYISLVLDYSDSVLKERELQTMVAQLRAALDARSMPTALLDEAGGIIFANKAWHEYHAGLLEDEAVPVLNCLRFFEDLAEHRIEARGMLHALRAVLNEPMAHVFVEHNCAPVNKLGWFSLELERFELGGLPRVLLSQHDITDLIEVREALNQAEDRSRQLIELIPDGLFVQQDGMFAFVNRRALEMFGARSPGEMLGRNVIDHVHETDRALVLDRMRLLREPGQHVPPMEETFLRLDGTPFEVEAVAASILHEGRGAALVVMRDVTERKRNQQAMLRASRMEATATLAGGIAHDFNNLMVGVLGNAELLQMHLASGESRDCRAMLEQIAHAAQRAGDLAQQMLAYARGGKYQPRPLRLNDSVEEVLKLQQRTLPPRIEIEKRLHATRHVLADATQIMQVLMNLGINAMEAIPQHGRIIFQTRNCELDESAELRAAGGHPGPGVCLRVADTGVGMSREVLDHIFEPFFTTKFTGRGLGLAAVYGIVHNHDGIILVHSRPDEGTEFLIYLPAYSEITLKLTGAGVEPGSNGDAPAEPVPPRTTVLMVDDETMVLDITERLLDTLGYQPLKALGAQEALEIARDHPGPIHLILLDLGMPGMGGVELLPLLQQARPQARILICSGYELDYEAEQLLASGAWGFVQKPYRMAELGPALHRALASLEIDSDLSTQPTPGT